LRAGPGHRTAGQTVSARGRASVSCPGPWRRRSDPGTPRCRRASPEAHLGQRSVRPSGTASARRVPTTLGAHCMEAVAQPPITFRLTPRPYQYEAVAALLAATARGVQRPLLVLPTGTGKTIVFALLVQRRRGRSLILAHRDELIQQAVDKLRLDRKSVV